jgi:VanZ family protein
LEECSNRHNLKFWLSAWLPVALGIGVILLESTEFMGADHTSRPLRCIFEAIFGPVSNIRWDEVHHLIRKCGHFFGYGTIGLLWLRALWMTLRRSNFYIDAFLALLGTMSVASMDEFHQAHLPNRTGSPWDVLLDCSGALMLQLVIYIYMRMKRPKSLMREG